MLFGTLVLAASGVLWWLAHELGEWVLYLASTMGAALGLSMLLLPVVSTRKIAIAADALVVGRRRYPFSAVELGPIRSDNVRGIEVLDLTLGLTEPDGRRRELRVGANAYWPLEQMHRDIQSALDQADEAS
jgi:hypothetical protein